MTCSRGLLEDVDSGCKPASMLRFRDPGKRARCGRPGMAKSRFYTIEAGDTLSKVAKKFYGDANRYPDIVKANRGVRENADRSYPGQVIRIPE